MFYSIQRLTLGHQSIKAHGHFPNDFTELKNCQLKSTLEETICLIQDNLKQTF